VEVAGEGFCEKDACGEVAGAVISVVGVGEGGVHNSFMGVWEEDDGLCL
jgi:hypothetical protein